MRLKFISIFLIAFCIAPRAIAERPPAEYQEIMARAGAAFAEENWAVVAANLDSAQTLRPYSLYIWKNRILARILNDQLTDAAALAHDIADRGLALDLSGHAAFERFKEAPIYGPIREKFENNLKPHGASTLISEWADTNLLPEAIAYDTDGSLYVGSVRTGKILKFETGSPEVIATAAGGVFDLEIRRDAIWAVVNNQLSYENADESQKDARIVTFDRQTGAVIHDRKVAEENALLGDLEITSAGIIFASDSITPRLYKLAPGATAPEVFATDRRFANLQGIALDEKNTRLFVADYLTGLFSVDINTGETIALSNKADAHLGGIDGLYLHQGDLIAIQNGTTPHRVLHIKLDNKGQSVVRVSVLNQNLSTWNEPTHGAIRGGNFNYIATSNWPAYDENGALREGAAPQPLRILSTPLAD